MEFKELLDYCKAQAIANTLEGNELTVWRSICRSYSQKFHTPLHLVYDMDPEEVMLAEFEDQLDGFKEEDVESILEEIYMLDDPDYESSKRTELKNFIEMAEEEEAERLRLGKPIHKAMKEETSIPETLPEKPKKSKENKPSGGSINLAYLEKMDSQDEDNGFD